jgi:hypothetical protein
LINFKQLHDLSDATTPPNHLLAAHLHILTAIYQRQPSLLNEDILNYLLYDCLFYKKGQSHQLEVACKRQETIKAALDVVQAGISDYKNPRKMLKIIE